MRILHTFIPPVIALLVASFADALMGNASSLVPYLVTVACVSWFGGRLAGISVSVAAMAVWAYINHAEPAGLGYALLSLGLILKSIILFSASLLVSLVRERAEHHSDLFYTDVLTGLYNMKAFRDIAEREINRCSRYGRPFSIAYLDADNFTKVTQAVGHKAGDELLVCIADNLRCNIRKSDIVARLGGDNFVLLLPETGLEPARNALINIKSKLDEAISDMGYFVTFSIGAMTWLAPPASVDEVFAACEAVMFRVKGSGKNAIRHESAAGLE